MGKKLKGGRRQILQLEEKKPPKIPSKSKVKNLIHYSDSDEDSKKSNESETSSTIPATKDATPLDSEIADFFKEIDALSVPEEPTEQSSSSSVAEESAKPDDSEAASLVSQPEAIDLPQNKIDLPNEEEIEITCAWQEICDDSTGYSYYWNMHTNEVTWDCPDEYAKYLQSLHSASKNNNQSEDPSREVNINKKAKRKKEPAKLPEGAIIPISYFGNSSSDDTSDSGSESPKKLPKRPKIEKPVVAKKTKVSRKQKRNVDEEVCKSEIIGPQLPPDFQFPQMETNMSRNAEIKEPVQMGPSLPSNYLNAAEETGMNGASIEASISEASSGKGEERNLHSKPTEKILDSTFNKADSVIAQTGNMAFGYRPVVDYDSFTDDEDADSNNAVISSHIEKSETKCSIPKIEDEHPNLINTIINVVEDKENDNPEVKVTNESKVGANELKTQSFQSLPKEVKRKDVDIDSLFAAHSSYGKHGFGFGWKEHSDTENEVASPSRQERKSYRGQTQMKSVSFVKSELVLDLGSLNEAESCEITNEERKCEIANSFCMDQTEENSALDSEITEGMQTIKDSMTPSIEDAMVSSKNVLAEQECADAVVNENEDSVVDDYKQKAELCMDLEGSSSSDSSSFELTDDLDEIDRALCEALYKKKAKNSGSVPSVSSNPSSTEVQKNTIETPMEPHPKCQKTVEKNSMKSKEDSDFKARILEMTSILIDKLTFLLSSSTSTLPSLNSLYIQLQTRFVDWQANALDSVYFEDRLTEVNQYLHHYETGVVSGNWACQWDRANKRYFYLNHLTQVSQWTFPEELFTQEGLPSNTSQTDSSGAAEKDPLLPVFTSSIECKDVQRSPSPPPPPPGVDSPLPPPPPSSPPSSPPPPPCSIERELEDMDLENSSDSNLVGLQQSPERPFLQSPATVFTSVSPPCHTSIERRTLFPILTVKEDTNLFSSEVSAPILSNVQAEPSEETPTTFKGNSGMEVCPVEASTAQNKTASKPAPVKRKKTKIQPGLGLRKKNIPSLVEKWQKIKEEQEREDSNSNDSKPNVF